MIKRIRPKLDEYDYIFVDSNKVEHLLDDHVINPNLGTIFEKAGIIANLEYKIKHIKKSSLFKNIILLIIGGFLTILTQFIYDKWIKKETNFTPKIETIKKL